VELVDGLVYGAEVADTSKSIELLILRETRPGFPERLLILNMTPTEVLMLP